MFSISEQVDAITDLLFFTKTLFKIQTGSDFKENHHHVQICNALGRVVIGDIKRLIINIPPRYSKTELAVINFIAWTLGSFPDSEFIHTSYSKKLAAQNTWKVKMLVESTAYRSIFPIVKIREDSKAKDEWRTEQGGIVYAAGAEGTITGYGAGKMRQGFGGAIIIDDPHKAGEANSPIRRANILDWFRTTLESRKNNPTTPIILIMQRLHEDDLSGYLLRGCNGEEWYHVCLPALDAYDNALWPEIQKKEDLERLRTNSPYVFAGQYMQKPAPLGGGIFKDDWWQFYDDPPDFQYKIITADTAQKTKNHNDYSVFQCWGKHGKNIYLIDQMRGKWEAPQLRNNMQIFHQKHNDNNLRRTYVEDKSSGTGLIQDLKRLMNIAGVQRELDKVTRSMDAAPYIASGFVFLPRESHFLKEYLAEFSSFTPMMTHSHDDQIDPTLDAIDILLRPKINISTIY